MARSRSSDVFPPSVESVSPSDYIVPAQDPKGNSERQWFRCQPAHDRAAQIIIQQKAFPWKTKGDFYRFCVYRGIKWAERQVGGGGKVRSVMQRADSMLEMLRIELDQAEFLEVFDAAERTIGKLTSHGATGEARRVVALMKKEISGMPEGYWRREYLRKLKGKYGHLLSAESGPASIRGGKMEGE